MTGRRSLGFSAPVQTFRYRQSSLTDASATTGAGVPLAQHLLPYCLASRGVVQDATGWGAFQRKSPTGGAAYGMPLKLAIPDASRSFPAMMPLPSTTVLVNSGVKALAPSPPPQAAIVATDRPIKAANTVEGKGLAVNYKISESLPLKVACDFHPWMQAYWMVVDHPYAAVTDKDGKFTIPNLPVGEHEFRVWHERKGYLNRKYAVKVQTGDNALKTMEIKIDDLKGDSK